MESEAVFKAIVLIQTGEHIHIRLDWLGFLLYTVYVTEIYNIHFHSLQMLQTPTEKQKRFSETVASGPSVRLPRPFPAKHARKLPDAMAVVCCNRVG